MKEINMRNNIRTPQIVHLLEIFIYHLSYSIYLGEKYEESNTRIGCRNFSP